MASANGDDQRSRQGDAGGRDFRDAGEGDHSLSVALLADPELAAAEVARHLAQRLPSAIARHLGEAEDHPVSIAYERLPASTQEHGTMLDHAATRRREWDVGLVICLTDLPLQTRGRPVVADVDTNRGVAVVSLPAVGGRRMPSRVRRLVTQLVADLVREERSAGSGRTRQLGQLRIGPMERISPESPKVDIRIAADNRLRLLAGMVRANRPWTLAFGLTKAMIAAFAISAFFMINSTVWLLADALPLWRLIVAGILSTSVLITWLIINHGLWERRSPRQRPELEHGQAALYNASTVITLTVGVLILYAGIFVILLAAAALILTGDVLTSFLQQRPGPQNYLAIAWLTTSAATIGGALGSSLDNDQTVRAAAYSYRERQRHTGNDQDTAAQ